MHSTGMTWIQLWTSSLKTVPLIPQEAPSHSDKGLSAKRRFEKRFQEDSKAFPVHYGQDSHWVSGNKGLSEWTLAGTKITGLQLEVRGCDLWEFENDKVKRKESYWKIVERT